MDAHVGAHDRDDFYVCRICLGRFDAPPDAEMTLRTLAGRDATDVRVVFADGNEVHRCAMRRAPGPAHGRLRT